MRKILTSFAVAIVMAFSGASISFAQDDGPPNFVPVEMSVCNYQDGKDSEDFDDAMDKMIKWMEDNDGVPYAAWRLNKWLTGENQEFDFIYLGAWPDGSTMGKDMAQYVSTGDDAIEAFDEAADCGANVMFASLNIKAAPENAGDNDFVLTMSNCTVAEGRKTSDATAAMRAYGEYRDANGSPGGSWLWFPAYGGGASQDGFDFKLVNSHAGTEGFGNHYQWVVENAAYLKQGELMDGLVSCDVARAYAGDTIIDTMTQD